MRSRASYRSARRPRLVRWLSDGPRLLTRLLVVPVAAILVSALLALVPGPQARAASCANPVACENALPGTPQSTWDSGTSNDTYIQGFADPFSVNVGGSINFKISSVVTLVEATESGLGVKGVRVGIINDDRAWPQAHDVDDSREVGGTQEQGSAVDLVGEQRFRQHDGDPRSEE